MAIIPSSSTSGSPVQSTSRAEEEDPKPVAAQQQQAPASAPRPYQPRRRKAPRGAGDEAGTYKVVKDDTLSKIAQRNGLSLAVLLKLNPHLTTKERRNGDLIYPGDLVSLGAKGSARAPQPRVGQPAPVVGPARPQSSAPDAAAAAALAAVSAGKAPGAVASGAVAAAAAAGASPAVAGAVGQAAAAAVIDAARAGQTPAAAVAAGAPAEAMMLANRG